MGRIFQDSRVQIALVYLVAQAFYLFTLAPTVLWGDDAKFEIQAYTLDLRLEHAWDHPFWVLLAHPFSRMPVGDVAFRINLFTSIWAAIAVVLVFAMLRDLTDSFWAGAVGSGSLMVSHTFWTHAVRAEVYSFNWAMLAISLYYMLHRKLNTWRLLVAALAASFAVNNHVMMFLALPGLIVLGAWRVWQRKLLFWDWLPAIGSFVVSIILYRLVFIPGFTVSVNSPSYLLSPGRLLREVFLFLAYWFLQFPSPAIVLAVVGSYIVFRQRLSLAICLMFIALANVAAALGHNVPDQYVFYSLAYLVCGIWSGLGVKPVVGWLRKKLSISLPGISAGLLACILILPILAYTWMPDFLPMLGITSTQLGIREIPGRPALEFFLSPSKRNYFGARQFAEQVLSQMPPDATIIADFTVAQPMLYLQIVECFRPDVQVAMVSESEQVPFAKMQSKHAAVFLALLEPYYDIDGLRKSFIIVAEGLVYRLQPKD